MVPKENNILSNNSYKSSTFHSAGWYCYMGRIHLFLISFSDVQELALLLALIKKDLACTEDQFCE